jgi:hypothetical protein
MNHHINVAQSYTPCRANGTFTFLSIKAESEEGLETSKEHVMLVVECQEITAKRKLN